VAVTTQGIATAGEKGQLPAFDIGFDQIDPIEPKGSDNRIEGGQRDQLLRNGAPTVLRPPETGQTKTEAGAALDRQRQGVESGSSAERYRQHDDIGEAVQPDNTEQD
jgi:hypothetical protein